MKERKKETHLVPSQECDAPPDHCEGEALQAVKDAEEEHDPKIDFDIAQETGAVARHDAIDYLALRIRQCERRRSAREEACERGAEEKPLA